MATVRDITCPECSRVWPTISEQGIVCDLYDKCYACLISQVVKIRDELSESSDYSVHNCDYCGGLSPKVSQCVQCGGKGWDTTDKPESGSVIELYPH